MDVNSLRPRTSTRDHRTLELRNVFPIPPPGTEDAFEIDRWFFFPQNMGVHDESFDPAAFYRDSQVLLRLHPLDLHLRELADLDATSNPGRLLLERAERLWDLQPVSGAAMSTIAQLFGAELADAVHEAVDAVLQHPRVADPAVISALCDDVFAALGALRRVRRVMGAVGDVAHPELLDSLAFADEFGCAVVDERLSDLALKIGARPELRAGTGDVVRSQLILADALTRLNARRRDAGYLLPNHHDGELYTYRLSLLKKMLQRSLYVDTRQSRADPLIATSAAMIAAGLAATWALIAQIPLIHGNVTKAQTAVLAAGAIGAYMVKDRIKDVVRGQLLRRWRPWDHNQKIVTSLFEHLDLSSFEGRSRERVRWQSLSAVEPTVVRLRQANRTVHGSSTARERVLHYSRRLELRGLEAEGQHPNTWGVQSIFRFSLADLMARLDDPVDDIAYFDEREGFQGVSVPKVYHINVVHRTRHVASGDEYFARLRVVLTRDRIVRIDQVEQTW